MTFSADAERPGEVCTTVDVEDNVDALLEGRLDLAFIFHGAKARRASRSSFSRTEPGALSSRGFADASDSPGGALFHSRKRRCEPFIGLVPLEFPDYHFFIDAVFASSKNKPRIVEEHDSVAEHHFRGRSWQGCRARRRRLRLCFRWPDKNFAAYPDPKTFSIGLAARKGTLVASAAVNVLAMRETSAFSQKSVMRRSDSRP